MNYNKNQKEAAVKFIDSCFAKNRSVSIKLITESKTLSQNSYLWLIFTIVAQETGNTPDDIYQYCLKLFPVFKELDINGIIDQIPVSLSGFTKEQMTNFIDKVLIYWRSEGFVLPDPEDMAVVKLYNEYKNRGWI